MFYLIFVGVFVLLLGEVVLLDVRFGGFIWVFFDEGLVCDEVLVDKEVENIE